MQVISADDGSKIVTLPNFDWSDVAAPWCADVRW